MSSSFEISPYSVDKLFEIFCTFSESLPERARQKPHYEFFRGYFEAIGAETILVENDYVDRNYLADCAGYYVLCFRDYARKCKRIHFFSGSFDDAQFLNLLKGVPDKLTQELLRQWYLGFIVAKPIPETFVGRCCIRTYEEGPARSYPITRPYTVNLFGIRLPILSLAFQEQDHVVAACATSALWSAFHGCVWPETFKIPSPIEITKSATQFVPSTEERSLPNSGLNHSQMAHAIKEVALEPYSVPGNDPFIFRGTIYAYLRGQVPILLLADLNNSADPTNLNLMGRHALLATGYNLGSAVPVPFGTYPFYLRSSRMDKIYCHDDQVGPFTRMEITSIAGAKGATCLKTEWKDRNGKAGNVIALPRFLLIPIYHKVRITFRRIISIVSSFDRVIRDAKNLGLLDLDLIEWDVFLTTVNTLKTDMIADSDLDPGERSDVLLRPLPRFIWRASGFCKDRNVIDLLFDATDIEQSSFLVHAVNRAPEFFKFIIRCSKNPAKFKVTKSDLEWKVLSWFDKLNDASAESAI